MLLAAVGAAAGGPAGRLVIGLAVGGAIAAGIQLHRPPRPTPWWLLVVVVGAATVLGVTGQVLAGRDGTPPPVLDYFYYPVYLVLAAALAMLGPRGRDDRSTAGGMAEAGILTCGAAVLWWILVIDPLSDAGRLPVHGRLLAFPLLDFAMLALAVRLVRGRRSPWTVLIALATAMLLVADTAYFVSATGSTPPLSAVCSLLANLLLGAAALHPSMARDAPAEPAPAGPPEVTATGPEQVTAAPMYLVIVVLAPLVTATYLMYERIAGTIRPGDIGVPLLITTLAAALLLWRIQQLNGVARRHAARLEQALRAEAELQRELRHRTQHDALTGLPNRALLYERIDAALAAATPGALIVLDIDDFKDVNDRLGHAVGDDLLVAVADRITGMLAGRAMVARLDSDEFAVLLEEATDREAIGWAEELLVAMRRPVTVQHHALFGAISVGLRGLDPDLLTADILRDAYVALHAAKAAGRDQLATFDQRMREQRLARARTVERLRGALDRDELLLHFQPLVRLADERYVGAEALLRWRPAGEAMVPPDAFIPEAEDSGLIVPIGSWVLHEACRVAAPWHRDNGAVVSVNASPRQLREPDFATQVLDALQRAQLPPQALILEITEGVLVGSGPVAEQAVRHLGALRERGVRVAVDDFGTGYSSLAYLRDLPIDHVKIDRSFMPGPGEPDPTARTLVKAIIDLATALGLGTIAEGVETAEQVALLRALGCERAQGFHFARPVPAAEAGELLARSHREARV
ncbi:diguanylate cyclase (GGDEF)-like protein [Krasilnikovia cinnamomea]|uniref:Diguanylate cyclase (GGDEF)-like protein n=1 Tax=Krasilnikovia cinnamomea TaxID=349313 RepID=A0A4Q7ZED8_9ACTN|nr:diguanylate cyclase (GGDEF)-like protein [Krasilnikovia cinnamomea]